MSVKMTMRIRVSEELKTLAQRYPKYAQAVLNRTANEGKTLVAKELSRQRNVQESFIKKYITVVRSTGQSLVAFIRFSERRFNPVWFLRIKEPTVYRERVELQVKRGASRTIGGGYFVNIGNKSQRMFIRRQAVKGDRQKLPLLPFIEAKEIFDMAAIRATLTRYVNQRLTTELPRVIKSLYRAGK